MINIEKRMLAAAVLVLISSTTMAQEVAPGLWDRLRDFVAPEQTQIDQMIENQEQLNTFERDLGSELQKNRQLRAMNREVTLLSAMNIAWIKDELDHWDCRIADQKVIEINKRIDELTDFNQRVNEMCDPLEAQAANQNQVCDQQYQQVMQSVQNLQMLQDRYATSCRGADSTTFQTEGEQPWQ